MENFAIVGARESFDWGLELGWRIIDIFCNSFPFLSDWERLYFAWISSLPLKYDIFKCLDIRLGRVVILLVLTILFVVALLWALLFCVVFLELFLQFL